MKNIARQSEGVQELIEGRKQAAAGGVPPPPAVRAKDGTLRGVSSKQGKAKTRTKKLLADMQKAVAKVYGIRRFDPVVQLALIGVQALEDREITDPATGKTTVIKADRNLAVAALRSAAPFVHAPIKHIEVSGKDGGAIEVSVEGAKQQLADMIHAGAGSTTDAEYSEVGTETHPDSQDEDE